jgi:TonB family protein
MYAIKYSLIVLLAVAAYAQAGGAASVVAQKSKVKRFTYSYATEMTFMNECTQGANQEVCYCVFGKIKQQYSEADYWKLENDLKNDVKHPEYLSFLTIAVDECDSEYAEKQNENDKFVADIDRVLKEVAGLQTTDKTVLGGRRGKTDGGFNEGYAEGGDGGIGDGLSDLFGGGGGGISTKAKGDIKIPSARDIDIKTGSGSRSAADIMKVVRQRTPGLRHIYNKFSKEKPGFQGKVILKFTIAPGGEIISISIASSTTGFGKFDAAIKSAVGNWTFSRVKEGNTTVTIPFTFAE